MFDKLHCSKRTYLIIGVSLAGVLAVVIGTSAGRRHGEKTTVQVSVQDVSVEDNEANDEQDPELPEGAKISDPSKDVIFADLEGDGRKEKIIFFSLPQQHKAGVAVLKPKGMDYTRFWEQLYDDSWGFYPDLTGVYDLNKSGKPQILAFHGIGASCPGQLRIYQSKRGKIEDISGPWADPNGCDWPEIKDLNGDGRSEIIIRTRNYGINPDVYSWNGKQYVKANRQFSHFYDEALQGLIQWINSSQSLPISARVMWSRQAVEIYLLQHRYAEAVAVCNGVLRIFDDPQLTKSNSFLTDGNTTPEQLESFKAGLEIEKTEGKATIHRLLGDIYKAAGNPQQAQTEYNQAQELESQAKDMQSKLLPMHPVPIPTPQSFTLRAPARPIF
jgi:hypothetical protein